MSDENVPDFGKLEDELLAIEKDVLPAITGKVANDRNAVIKAFATLNADRLKLGQAISSYRQHFKARRSWLRIAEVLSRRLGRCRSTLYNLMGDSERALKLTKVRRAALRAEGVEPAKMRFAPILSDLAGGPEDESMADARIAVKTAIATFNSQQASSKGNAEQSTSMATALDEFAQDEIARIEQFAKRHPDLRPEFIAEAMTRRIQAWSGSGCDPDKPETCVVITSATGDPLAVDENTCSQDGRIAAAGYDADRLESAQVAGKKRPPAPVAMQQPTLFDNFGGEIA